MAGNPLAVRGWRELDRAFGEAGKTARVEFRDETRRAIEPVRIDMAQASRQEISRIGDRWSEFRVGVTQKVVYIVPKARGDRKKSERGQKFNVRLGRVMERTLERHRHTVEQAAERILDKVETKWETA